MASTRSSWRPGLVSTDRSPCAVSTTRTEDLTAPGQLPSLDALVSGYSLAFWVAAGFAAVSLATTLLILKREDLVSEPEAAHAPGS